MHCTNVSFRILQSPTDSLVVLTRLEALQNHNCFVVTAVVALLVIFKLGIFLSNSFEMIDRGNEILVFHSFFFFSVVMTPHSFEITTKEPITGHVIGDMLQSNTMDSHIRMDISILVILRLSHRMHAV